MFPPRRGIGSNVISRMTAPDGETTCRPNRSPIADLPPSTRNARNVWFPAPFSAVIGERDRRSVRSDQYQRKIGLVNVLHRNDLIFFQANSTTFPRPPQPHSRSRCTRESLSQ